MRRITKGLLFAVAMMLGWSLGGCSGPIKAEHLSNVRLDDGVRGDYVARSLRGEVHFDRAWRGDLYFRYTLLDGSTEVRSVDVVIEPSPVIWDAWGRSPASSGTEFSSPAPDDAVGVEFVRSKTFRPVARVPHTETFYVERIYHNPSGSSVWTVK